MVQGDATKTWITLMVFGIPCIGYLIMAFVIRAFDIDDHMEEIEAAIEKRRQEQAGETDAISTVAENTENTADTVNAENAGTVEKAVNPEQTYQTDEK